MVRSAHKKSRRGCSTCKKRHVKCDESKPSCINCVTVNRRCAYLDEPSSTSNNASAIPSTSSTVETSLVGSASTPVALPASIPSDLVYVHALNQWMCHTQEIFCPSVVQHHHPGTIMLDHALKHPFLLHGLLALSTFHIGKSQPENQEAYQGHSRRLLTQGLEGFNSIVTRLNEENIIPAFVFSTVAGFCKFAHVFATVYRSVNDFLDQLIESITMLRGVNIVLGGWWHVIKESALFRALYPDTGPPKIEESSDQESEELSDLRRFLRESNLDASSFYTCNEAAAQLQAIYNLQTNTSDEPKSETPDFVFFIRLPGAFHTLVLQRNPEALVIVAYLAPLLHRRRHSWMVGNAGEVLINAICDYLGPTWHRWLQSPINAIKSAS